MGTIIRIMRISIVVKYGSWIGSSLSDWLASPTIVVMRYADKRITTRKHA